ncbi:MAG: type II toxin-antitoxin system VapC family toxin [Nevskiales bacterium]
MIKYVLDTNTLSELMRERPDPRLETKLSEHRKTCAIPAPVIDELQFGVSRMSAPERRAMYQGWLEALMADFPVIPLDGLCAQWHGRERARLTSAGKTPSLYDGLIASIAAVNELTLVTRNQTDFANFNNLKLENWFES